MHRAGGCPASDKIDEVSPAAEASSDTSLSDRSPEARVDARTVERRAVYLGEGLTLNLASPAGSVAGEIIDLTPEGFGIAVLDGTALPDVGDAVVLEHTGLVTRGIRHRANVRSVSEQRIGGRRRHRIGVALVIEVTPAGRTQDRRALERYPCPAGLPAIASAPCPLFFREWLSFRVLQVGAGGMTLASSIRNKALLVGLELAFSVTLPMSGVHRVRGRITSVRRGAKAREFVVGVAWIEPPRSMLVAISEYLLLGDKALSPPLLRAGGLPVGSVERAVTYDYAAGPRDYDEILSLRLRAHQVEGRLVTTAAHEMASPHDKHSRHLTCRFGRRIVGYLRLNYVEGEPSRSQYVVEGGHEVPDWLWKEGFVEGGAAAIDPDFQGAGLYIPLLQHALRVAVQSGYRYLVAAVGRELLELYEGMGFEILDRRVVEPKPGWRFESYLICVGADRLVQNPPEGKPAMTDVLAFVSPSDRSDV